MLKSILSIKGAKSLHKAEQQLIRGGKCFPFKACEGDTAWSFFSCSCE